MKIKDTYILGISSDFHDSAAVILKNGKLIAAAQEERFTRKKQDSSFPVNSIDYCLEEAGISGNDLTHVGYYEDTFLKFERLLINYAQNFPKSYKQFILAIPQWTSKKLWVKHKIRSHLNYLGKITVINHHLSHAASAFYPSGFEESAILTIDGVGEWDTTTISYGKGNKIKQLKSINYPNSIGLLYSAITYYLGFKVNSAEYKVMGLAPYGKPIYVEKFRKLIDIKDDGSFALDMSYFNYEFDTVMINSKVDTLFGRTRRTPETKLEQFHFDVASSLQVIVEEAILNMASHAKKITKSENLCLAGGVALNCVANSKILNSGIFKNVFIQPASGDAGCALGVALFINHTILNNKREKLDHVYYGPQYSNQYIENALSKLDIKFKKLDYKEIYKITAREIKNGKVIGWYQDRMEYGPRALGNRSILANPSIKDMKSIVNQKIKFREGFRPFAPSVLEEDIQEYFDLNVTTPYMLLTAQTKVDNLPAITHVDKSARIQSVSKTQNEKYHNLISEFKKISGLGLVLNTSFNVRGEPIVCTPENALACFFGTHMDVLVLQNYLIYKEDNKDILFYPFSSRTKFELD